MSGYINGHPLVALYNLVEFLGWIVVGGLLVSRFNQNPDGVFHDIRVAAPDVVQLYTYLQVLQMMDVVFAAFGLIGSNLFIAFGQNSVRTLFALTSARLHKAYYPVFFVTLICFTTGEIARYGVSFFKCINCENSLPAKILAEVRWNAFLVCYPLGASLEMVMHLEAVPVLQSMDPMPYSWTMPNMLNFAFNFSYLLIALPFIALYQFPINYKYLLVKRAQFYAGKNGSAEKKR